MFKVSTSSSSSENVPLLQFKTEPSSWSPRNRRCLALALQALDLFISAFVATPLTCTYWIATWDLFTMYIFEADLILSCAITGTLANLFLWLVYLAQSRLQHIHDSIPDTNPTRILFKAAFRLLYTYLTSLGITTPLFFFNLKIIIIFESVSLKSLHCTMAILLGRSQLRDNQDTVLLHGRDHLLDSSSLSIRLGQIVRGALQTRALLFGSIRRLYWWVF